MTCGIYCITNNINGMQYVGQSVNIQNRFQQHIKSESNSDIHNAIVQYGAHNFRFEILVECLPTELDEQEVKFIRLLDTYNNGYNKTMGGQHRVFNVEWEYDAYSELEKSNTNLKNKLKKKDKKIRDLTKENKALELKISDLEEREMSLISRVTFLEKTMDKMKKSEKTKINRLNQKISQLKNNDQYLSIIKKNKSLKQENEDLKFEIENMKGHSNPSCNESNIFYKIVHEKKAEVK